MNVPLYAKAADIATVQQFVASSGSRTENLRPPRHHQRDAQIFLPGNVRELRNVVELPPLRDLKQADLPVAVQAARWFSPSETADDWS
jgi:DNA-binding NtrC family response regulator